MLNNLFEIDTQVIWKQQEHLKATNILYFDPMHIVEPWALKYQQQFKALPKLEILAHGLTMPTIVTFHKKEQWHIWTQKYFGIWLFLKQNESLQKIWISMKTP